MRLSAPEIFAEDDHQRLPAAGGSRRRHFRARARGRRRRGRALRPRHRRAGRCPCRARPRAAAGPRRVRGRGADRCRDADRRMVPARGERPARRRRSRSKTIVAAWRSCLAALPSSVGTLLLRDYHKDNLLWLPTRPGVRACGLLDFQDAQRGHPSYDLVSLIEDARRDVAPAVHAACLERYIAGAGLDRKGFPHRLRADGRAAPCPHHRAVRPPAAA